MFSYDESYQKLQEVPKRECNPVVAVDALADLLAKNKVGDVGNDHQESSQTHRIDSVKNNIDYLVIGPHYSQERSDIQNINQGKQSLKADPRRNESPDQPK